MTVTKFESNLLDAVTAIVMTPVAAVYWLLWLLWQGVVVIAPYRKYIGLALAGMGLAWLFVAVPALPLGLALVGAYGWATMPRSPLTGGWYNVSWNSKAVGA